MTKNTFEHAYLHLLHHLVAMSTCTNPRPDRTGVGTYSMFGYQLQYDADPSAHPALTTKRLNLDAVVAELLWFLSGSTNVRDLHPVKIWDAWADEDGELGSIYSAQWRRWRRPDGRTVDQIAQLVRSITGNPYSRRHILSAWNAGEIEDMALAPCHVLAQFYVEPLGELEACQRWFEHCAERGLGFSPNAPHDSLRSHGMEWGTLHAQLYQRSADVFLGLPFNIASYALLLNMLAHVTRLRPGRITHTLGDVHLYANHLKQAREQLGREPRTPPRLRLTPPDSFNAVMLKGWTRDHIHLEGYDPHPAIRAPIAV